MSWYQSGARILINRAAGDPENRKSLFHTRAASAALLSFSLMIRIISVISGSAGPVGIAVGAVVGGAAVFSLCVFLK